MTDQGLALVNVVEVLIPSSVHLLCVFHVTKNIGAKCKEFVEVNIQSM